ncbi:Protein HOS4, partial [Fusarium oxysporum f. sp. albedinis]
MALLPMQSSMSESTALASSVARSNLREPDKDTRSYERLYLRPGYLCSSRNPPPNRVSCK